MRIGIIAMNHESNTFISTPTTLDDFRRESLLTGDAIVERWESAAHEIGGFLAGVRRAGAELVPNWCRSWPPGRCRVGPLRAIRTKRF